MERLPGARHGGARLALVLPCALAALLCAGACGSAGNGSSSGVGSATVNGTAGFLAQAAISGTWMDLGGGASTPVLIASPSLGCPASTTDGYRNAHFLLLQLAELNPSTFYYQSVTQPGTFEVNSMSANGVRPYYWTTDVSCAEGSNEEATAGQVLVTNVSPSGISGTFDLTLQGGDRITGTFDAPTCAALSSAPDFAPCIFSNGPSCGTPSACN